VQTLPMNIGRVGRVGASAKEVLGRLTEDQQEQFERLSSEYLNIFKELGGPGAGGAEKYYKLWFASGAGAAGIKVGAFTPASSLDSVHTLAASLLASITSVNAYSNLPAYF